MTRFDSPDELYRYVAQTIQIFKDRDLLPAAEMLANVQGNVYATGSEWLGDLGLAVRAIEATYSVPDDVKERLDSIMGVVEDTWPRI
jgi:hypothetical protein